MANDRFIRLLTRELSDQLTDAEREELKLLLQDNTGYREQKEILEDYWKRDRAQYAVNAAMFKKVLEKIREAENAGTTEPDGSIDGENNNGGGIDEERIDTAPVRRRFLPAIWYSAAAVMLILAGFLINHSTGTSSEPKKQPIAINWLQKITKPTIKSVITLSDGTLITLNSATVLRYPDSFRNDTREVYLDGEAYFDVAKDPARPFIIHASKMNIKVLGTSFNVKSYQNESLSEATLIRGSIEVTLNDRPSDRIILKPKEKLIVQNSMAIKKRTDLLASPASPDSAGKGTRYSLTNLTYFPNRFKTVIETSWVENKLVFSGKDFAQLSGQLERWYGVHIEFQNEQVKAYRFTGLFEKETLPEALDALKMTEHFNYKISNSTVYIY